jgi:pimeloyl-ACP methyl ester carboxylesterase
MKPVLLLLHGAIGSQKQLAIIKDSLSAQFDVYSLDFSGHGGSEIPDQFSISVFAKDVLDYLKTKDISSINIFGYSMGGYVALYLARHFPKTVQQIFTLATKLDWREVVAEKEAKMLVPEKIEEKVPAFAMQLKERHEPQDWKIILRKTADMMLAMGKNPPLSESDFRQIKHTARLGIGDQDKMVSVEETQKVKFYLPNSSLLVMKETQHPIEQVNVSDLCREISDFFIHSGVK